MAITNKIPQFDKSKTNLGEAPADGFKANTLVKSEEVNKAIYDCSLSITALIQALNNTYGEFAASNRQIDSSQSVDEIANTLSLILGLGIKDATISTHNGEQWINAYGLKYNGMPLLLKKINDYSFDSFLIQDKNFVCTSLYNFNDKYINSCIPITAFYLVENDVYTTVKNIYGNDISFRASKGDIYPMYKALQKQGKKFWFNYQHYQLGQSGDYNTISLLCNDGSYNNNSNWRDYIIPCPETGTIYVVGIDSSIMDNGTK
jgi:hypothetical protein